MTTIDKKAMLVKLNISQWTARKHEKAVDKVVAKEYNADESAGRYNKSLINKDALKGIQRVANDARTYHYSRTLPWKDDGFRVLPSAIFFDYSQKMREFEDLFQLELQEFLNNYVLYINQAQIRLGSLFDQSNYPTCRDLTRKFNFETDITPFPTASDFRVDLNSAEVDRIKQSIEKNVDRAINDAQNDLYNRIAVAVGNMAERLADKDAIFRDSLVGNLRELVELIPKLTLKDDLKLQDILNDIDAKLCDVEPQDLRDDKDLRTEKAKQAQDILDNLGFI